MMKLIAVLILPTHWQKKNNNNTRIITRTNQLEDMQ